MSSATDGSSMERHNDDDDERSSSTYSENGKRKSKGMKGKCYNCSKRGHFSHECSKKKHEEALLATVGDEPTLL